MRSYVHTYTCIIYCCTVVFYVLYKSRLGFTVHLLIFKLKMRSIIETIGEYVFGNAISSVCNAAIYRPKVYNLFLLYVL